MSDNFRQFGTKAEFALEIRLTTDPCPDAAPFDSAGSWGEWRLWVAGLNLCTLEYRMPDGLDPASEIRWYLAPLFRWIVGNWTPLLHEGRQPAGGRWDDSRPRWARLAYLAMLESAGDDMGRFGPWQAWASRHALRSSAEGGVLPDVFFQRVGDDIEISWGDRIQPGAEAASFVTDDGTARVTVDAVATVFKDATDWFCGQIADREWSWALDLKRQWLKVSNAPAGHAALHWFLDSCDDAGPLSRILIAGLKRLKRPVPVPVTAWWGVLAPEVAMFGAVTPELSEQAAVTLLSCYFEAREVARETEALTRLRHDDPAWMAFSPWASGYSLAEEVLDDADPDPGASRTDIEALLRILDIAVKDVALSSEGPRGVAMAGESLRPTILVNLDHPANRSHGRHFTEAHELCHILFDRERARTLAHSSTPWAPPAVEQRANAFAAMLLMPIARAKRPPAGDLRELRQGIRTLAKRLHVSQTALQRHLANVGQISPYEIGALLGDGDLAMN